MEPDKNNPFSSLKKRPEQNIAPQENSAAQDKPPVREFDATTSKVIIIGTILGLILNFVPFLHFIFGYFSILTHELGHAMFAWIFGRFAIPSFDFLFGGGVTMIYDRAMGFEWFATIALAILLILSWRNNLRMIWLTGFSVVYLYLMCSHADEVLGIFMGHGSELIFAGIFLYRGISSYACSHEAERYAYMMLGAFMIFHAMGFAHGLLFDKYKIMEYYEGKGGLLDNDFVRIADDYWHVKLSTVVSFYYALVLLTPVVTVWMYRHRDRWWRLLERLLSSDGQGKPPTSV